MSTVSPSPQRIFETLGAFQRTAAMRAAIELDLFTAIGEGADTVSKLAQARSVSERGVQILSDYLTMLGFLNKNAGAYSLGSDAAAFLDKRSPVYLGAAAAAALAGEPLVSAFAMLTEAARRGGTALSGGGTLAPEHPIWVEFARAMAVPGAFLARLLADCLYQQDEGPMKVLDIAAGHGLYGIEFAKRNPRTEAFAVDWQQVLAVARGNAETAGVADRFHTIPGDALTVDFGSGYDLALVTNFLPDLDSSTKLLKRIHSALRPHGRAVAFELLLNEDRVSPVPAVALSLALLATTPAGEARTAKQLEEIFRKSGFALTEVKELSQLPHRIFVGYC